IKAMDQVSGPVIAVGLVLSAVFVPCMFISGITGQFFRQFAMTIAVSTLISMFNSLTLSPALTALLLRPRHTSMGPPLPRLAFPLLGGFLAWKFLSPALTMGLDRLQAGGLNGLRESPLAIPTVAVVIGVVAGWFVSKPLN